MKTPKWVWIVIGIAALATVVSIVLDFMSVAEGSEVGTIFCSGRIVDVGDPEIELLSKCGSPTTSSPCDQDYYFEPNHVRRKCVVTHYYNRGSGQFMKAVTVSGGRVIGIQDLDYGN